jgi:acyl-CoA thioesterase-1
MNRRLKAFCWLLAALALSLPAQAARNILVFGDSLSAAYGITRDASWVNLMQQELRRSHPQFEVVNASISGETASGGVRRIGKALQKHRPEVVIIELGANDGLRGAAVAGIEKNLDQIISQSRKSGARVLLLGIQLPPNYGLEYPGQFRTIYPALAKRHKIALVPFILEGIPPEQFQPDNLHPVAAAQPQLMRNILPTLLPLLR